MASCDRFQYPLGGTDNLKKCNICGAVTFHFGAHEVPTDEVVKLAEEIAHAAIIDVRLRS